MPAGRPKYEITEEVIKQTESLAAAGLTHREIALSLGISYQTLNEKSKEFSDFSDAIKRGKAKGVAQVANALFKKATEGDTVAQKYFLNNRAEDWSEKRETAHTGPDGGPIKIAAYEVNFTE